MKRSTCSLVDRGSPDRYLPAMRKTPVLALLALLATLALPAVASAQEAGGTAPLTLIEGDYRINQADLDAACDAPVDIVVAANGDATITVFSILTTYEAYAYWVSDTSDCSGTIPDGDDRIAGPEQISLPELVTEFPTDFGDTFDQSDVIAALAADACTTRSSPSVRRNLCIVINAQEVSGDPRIEQNYEYYGWMTFEIDTEAPPAPDAPEITEMDASLLVTTAITDTSSENDDIASFQVRYREVPDPADDLTCDDDAYPSDQDTDIDAVDDALEWTLEGLDNGTTYEVCVRAEDDAGNTSPWSDLVIGTPIDECDFIECFPGGAPIGYCGAGLSPMAALICGLLLALRRRRSR